MTSWRVRSPIPVAAYSSARDEAAAFSCREASASPFALGAGASLEGLPAASLESHPCGMHGNRPAGLLAEEDRLEDAEVLGLPESGAIGVPLAGEDEPAGVGEVHLPPLEDDRLVRLEDPLRRGDGVAVRGVDRVEAVDGQGDADADSEGVRDAERVLAPFQRLHVDGPALVELGARRAVDEDGELEPSPGRGIGGGGGGEGEGQGGGDLRSHRCPPLPETRAEPSGSRDRGFREVRQRMPRGSPAATQRVMMPRWPSKRPGSGFRRVWGGNTGDAIRTRTTRRNAARNERGGELSPAASPGTPPATGRRA